MYYIYVHTNKINNKKYVGKTSRKPEYRWNKGKGYIKNSDFFQDIKKYGWNNFDHEVVYQTLSEEEANKKEIEFIKQYNTQDSNFGYNIMSGGIHCFMNEKHKILCSERLFGDGNPMYGKKRPDTSEFNKKTKTGVKQSEEHIKKRVEKNKGQKRTSEQRARMKEAAIKRWKQNKENNNEI